MDQGASAEGESPRRVAARRRDLAVTHCPRRVIHGHSRLIVDCMMPLPSLSWAHSRMAIGLCVRWRRVADAARMTAALAEKAWNIALCAHRVPAHRVPALDALTALAVLDASGADVPVIIFSGESGEETAVAAIRAGAADFVSLDHVDWLSDRRPIPSPPARRSADAGASRRGSPGEPGALPNVDRDAERPLVSLRPLRDRVARIVDFVYEYPNGAACVANIVAGEDLVGMRVLDRVSRSTASTTRRAT